jgi:uncharacterized protein YecT (DUF1311 family)
MDPAQILTAISTVVGNLTKGARHLRYSLLAPTPAITLALLLGSATSAGAQTSATAHCDSLGGQQPMNACYVEVASHADQRLLRLVDELRRILPAADFAKLQATHALWQRYRDSQCRWERSFVEGGTIAPMIAATCRIVLTENRIAELRPFLCEGAPLEGPCAASRRYGDTPAEPDSVRPN